MHLDKEQCPISNMKPLSKSFNNSGGELFIKDHDVTITVPTYAVSTGDEVEVQAAASLTGPYKLPDDCSPVSIFVWMGADYIFKKPVRIRIPHCVPTTYPNDSFDMVVLTVDKKDIVLDENGDLMLQMHVESTHDYQYEVSDYYYDYYTDHFCSKCLAIRRRFRIFKVFSRLTLSAPRELPNPNTTRITVFFCVPEDYETADELLIELCICYSLKRCLQVCDNNS